MVNESTTFETLIPKIANFLSDSTDAGNIILLLQNSGFDVSFETYNRSARSKKDFLHELLVNYYQQNNHKPILKLAGLLTVTEYFRNDYDYKYDIKLAQSLQSKIKKCFEGTVDEATKEKRLNGLLFDILNLHKGIAAVSKDLFIETHYEQATSEACKFLENYVQDKIGIISLTGVDLMSEAFKSENPLLSLYSIPMDAKQKNEQEGFHLLTLGEVKFLKNRLSHRKSGTLVKTRSYCLKILGFISILLETIDNMTSNTETEDIPF